MPVLLEDHNSKLTLRPETTKSNIVAYLYQNPEWGYSPQDITDQGYYQGEITPIIPDLDFDAPHDRDQRSSAEPAPRTYVVGAGTDNTIEYESLHREDS